MQYELKHTGVGVTVVCPGPVATNFIAQADMTHSTMFKQAQSADDVAAITYKAMRNKKRTVVTQKRLAFMLYYILPFMPKVLQLLIIHKMQSK